MCVIIHPVLMCSSKAFAEKYVSPILSNSAIPYHIFKSDIEWENIVLSSLESIYMLESEEYFVCMPFIAPSGVCLVVSKSDVSDARRIDLSQKPEFMGASLVEGVVEGKLFSLLNAPNEKALENDSKLKDLGEDANPVLMLFSLKLSSAK